MTKDTQEIVLLSVEQGKYTQLSHALSNFDEDGDAKVALANLIREKDFKDKLIAAVDKALGNVSPAQGLQLIWFLASEGVNLKEEESIKKYVMNHSKNMPKYCQKLKGLGFEVAEIEKQWSMWPLKEEEYTFPALSEEDKKERSTALMVLENEKLKSDQRLEAEGRQLFTNVDENAIEKGFFENVVDYIKAVFSSSFSKEVRRNSQAPSPYDVLDNEPELEVELEDSKVELVEEEDRKPKSGF